MNMLHEPQAKNLHKTLSRIVTNSETPAGTKADLLVGTFYNPEHLGLPQEKKSTTKDEFTIKNHTPRMNTNSHEGELAEAIGQLTAPENWS